MSASRDCLTYTTSGVAHDASRKAELSRKMNVFMMELLEF